MKSRVTAFSLLVVAATVSTCFVGPQPLPPDDPFCGGPEELFFEARGESQIAVSGTWSGDAFGFEVANLDTDEPSLFVDIDEFNRFSFEIDADENDRLRIMGAGGTCFSEALPRDYIIESGEVMTAPSECLHAAPMVTCYLASEGETMCVASWPAHNLCDREVTILSATPRAAGDVELETALPITLEHDELATLSFTVGAGDRVSQIFFINLEGAEEATIAVTVRLEPFL